MKRIAVIVFCIAVSVAVPAAAEERGGLFALTYADVEKAVGEALADKGVAEKVVATVADRRGETVYSYGKPLTVEVRGVQFEKASGRWSANLLVISEGQVVSALPASGRFEALMEIPVLKRVVKNGGTISASDIEIRDMAASQVRGDTITDIAGLIGKSPAYSVSAGRPIREHEVAVPALIRRNSVIQMHYRSPGMEITTNGQALQDGHKGDVIDVKNLASNKIVQAIVEDASGVRVTSSAGKRQTISVRQGTSGEDIYAKN